MADNPYMPDRGQMLAQLLMNLGGGISTAANAGLPGWQGIGMGAANYSNALAQQQQFALQQGQQNELMDLRKRQVALQEGELKDKQDERARSVQAAMGWTPPGGGETPRMGVAAAGPTMGPGADALRRGQEFTGYLTGKYGMSPAAASGVVGGLYQESGFDPRAVGDNGTAGGMGQWRLDRREGLAKFAQSQGRPADDPYLQLDYLMNEMKGGDMGARRAYAMLQSARTPEDATTAMMHFFRPAGYTPANPAGGHGYANRVQYAQSFMPGGGGPQVAQGDNVATRADGSGTPLPPSRTATPPMLEDMPRPALPAADAQRLTAMVRARAMTPQQADAEANRIVSDLWGQQRAMATARYQQESENYRYNRGLDTEGEWVRGADGTERFVPKSGRSAGMTRTDKPPEPGTEAGDIRILTTGVPASREYKAAYNRLRAKPIDGPNGMKYLPDMSAYAEPTFIEPNAAKVEPAKPGEVTATPPGLTLMDGDRKYTETQNKDHTYAERLNLAIPQLEAMVKGDDGKYSTAKLPDSIARGLAMGDIFGMKLPGQEAMVSGRAKEFRRVVKDIVTATLRRESGASIAPSEFQSEYEKFIPQVGDSDAIIRNKMEALKVAARSIAEGTGRPLANYKYLSGIRDGATPQAPAATPIRIDMSGRRQ